MENKNVLYAKTMEALQAADPCGAATCIFQIESHFEDSTLDPKFRILKKECLEQLYLLAKENLESGNMEEIMELINSYTLLQDDERIKNIKKKFNAAKQQVHESREASSDDLVKQNLTITKGNIELNIILFIGGLLGILIFAIICYVMWGELHNNNISYTSISSIIESSAIGIELSISTNKKRNLFAQV